MLIPGIGLTACGGGGTPHSPDGSMMTIDAPQGTADAPQGTADAPPGTPDAGPGAPDATPPADASPAIGFTAGEHDWYLPSGVGNTAGVNALTNIFGTSFSYWFTRDMDGDGKPDLVATTDPATGFVWNDATGVMSWHVFHNTGTQFSATFTAYVIPAGVPSNPGLPEYEGTMDHWTTLDINNDGFQDLCFTADPISGSVFVSGGQPFWNCFMGNDTGFTAAVLSWTVPTTTIANGFNRTSQDSGNNHWATFDVNGDHLPDLVETANPATGTVFSALGVDGWHVYLNNGADGFSTTVTAWIMPHATMAASGVYRTQQYTATDRWFLRDLDGDQHIDLVFPADPTTMHVWSEGVNEHWVYYPGNATGFSFTAASWSVPHVSFTGGVSWYIGASGAGQWQTIDMDHDGYPDILQTTDPSTGSVNDYGTTAPYWLTWWGTATGTTVSGTNAWYVPVVMDGSGYISTYYESGNEHEYALDMNGDGIPDLVTASDPTTGSPWGIGTMPYWKVYFGNP
jgi:hypothetical protein